MSWERDILAMPTQDLARANGAELLAVQLQNQIRDYLATIERHQSEIAKLQTTLTETQMIGLAVIRAAQAGRRTLRISELIQDEP